MTVPPSTSPAVAPPLRFRRCLPQRAHGWGAVRALPHVPGPAVPLRKDLVRHHRPRRADSARGPGGRLRAGGAGRQAGERRQPRWRSSPTRSIAGDLRGVALPLVMALSVVIELRTILIERQAALDDAGFQLRALRQVARLLSSVHSTEETEQLVLDFMAEVFFAWWACLYRPDGAHYHPEGLPLAQRPPAARRRSSAPRSTARSPRAARH